MKRIAFVTLSRSDYTSLRPVAIAAEKDPDIDLTLIAGGSHLLQSYGESIQDIRKDGYQNLKTIDFLKDTDDSDSEIAQAYASAVAQFTDFFTQDKPNMVFIIGDRWEMMAVASVASLLRIPLAHHSGGDITQGSADNQTRYVLTTLAHLHFVALEEHRQRLLQMGEECWRVTVTGEPALSRLETFKTSNDPRRALGVPKNSDFALATFHPTSYDPKPLDTQIELFLRALNLIEIPVVLTAPNPDAGSTHFYQKQKSYAEAHEHIFFHENLGAERYYAAMGYASFMIGNSSSGLWEAPSFGLPVINIGPRQDGRVRGQNVIDSALEIGDIKSALEKAKSREFRAIAKAALNPYVQSDCIEKILAGLKTSKTGKELLSKTFVDPLVTETIKSYATSNH